MNNLNKLLSFIDFSPFGLLIFDENFNIIYVNNNFLRFGVTSIANKEYILSKNILTINLFSDKKVIDEILKIKQNSPFEIELASQVGFDNNTLKIVLKGTPFFDEDKFNGGILIIDDFVVNINNNKNDTDNFDLFTNFLTNNKKLWIISDITGNIINSSPQLNINNISSIIELFINENKNEIIETLVNLKNIYDYQEKELYSDYFGGQKVFNTSFFVINDNTKNPLILLVLNDITANKIFNKEKELKEIEIKKLTTVLNNLADLILSLDDNGQIVSITKNNLQFSNIENYKLIGHPIEKLIPSLKPDYFDKLKQDIFSQNCWNGKLNFYKDDTEIILETTFLPIEDSYGKLIILICKDITNSYLLEKELRKSEEHFRSIVTNSKEFILTFDLKGNIKYINPHFSKEFKVSFDDALLLNICDFINQDELEENFNFEKITLNKITSFELPLKKLDGKKIYVAANFTPVLNLTNQLEYFIGIFTDITTQKNAEKDLLLIKTVFEASQEGIAVESNNILQLVNDSFAKIFGYDSPNEIIGINPIEFIHKSDRIAFLNIIEKLLTGNIENNRLEIQGLKKNGATIICELSLGNYQIGKNDYIVIIVRDITKEKEAQKALEISEERYRSITENINEFIWVAELIDNKLQVVLYTDAVLKITGFLPNEFIKDKNLWHKIIHPNDIQMVIPTLKKFYKSINKHSLEIEYRIIHRSGDILWIKNKISVVRDTNGFINKIFGLVSDITTTKKNEEELKNYAESMKQLNETKDRFLSIVSHDLRTPFSSILGFTDILLNNRNLPTDKIYEYISFIHESSTNMLNLVNSLLDWTRIQTGRVNFVPEKINALSLINKSVQTSTGVAIQKGIEIYINVDKNIYIHADENLMFQVFNNLLSNAVKFCKKGDKIEISAKRNLDNNFIEFCISDTGVGIKKEDQDKLFKVETKFTLKGTSGEKGSGLGLSLVYDIIKKHQGNIWLESEYGKGTKFFFTCPISSSNILLVDDVTTDRILYTKLLKSLLPNYNVYEATDGKDALEKIKQLNPAVVVTDHQMPNLSGNELIKTVLNSKIKYKPQFILLTMYLDDNIIELYKNLGIEFIFSKPVNITNFKFALEKSLKKAFLS